MQRGMAAILEGPCPLLGISSVCGTQDPLPVSRLRVAVDLLVTSSGKLTSLGSKLQRLDPQAEDHVMDPPSWKGLHLDNLRTVWPAGSEDFVSILRQ